METEPHDHAPTTTTSLDFERDGATVQITGIPATYCAECEDLMLDGPLVVDLEALAQQMFDRLEASKIEKAPAAHAP
jgi:YgiT-type zinc finger domain-containing protein